MPINSDLNAAVFFRHFSRSSILLILSIVRFLQHTSTSSYCRLAVDPIINQNATEPRNMIAKIVYIILGTHQSLDQSN